MAPTPADHPYNKFTLAMAFNLASPHTWTAAIIPALLGISIVAIDTQLSLPLAICCVLICVLFQSAVNTLNDYYDFKKGTDSASDNVDPSDAVLVYNNVDPKIALRCAIGYIAAAFILGIPCIVHAGIAPLIIALIGALFVVIYSAGKTPISYLPLGEIVSGFVMGGLIPLAVSAVLSGSIDYIALVYAIPEIIGIGLIMLTNNISDIEKDKAARRKTLPVLLGRPRARKLYQTLIVIWMISIIAIAIICFTGGTIFAICGIIVSYPLVKALMENTFTPKRRLQSMPQILSLNIALGAFYIVSILASALL